MKMKWLFILFFLFFEIVDAKPIRRRPRWRFSSTTNFWLQGEVSSLQETPLASHNSPFAVPKQIGSFLIQENFSAKKRRWEWVFRPSVGTYQRTYSLFPEEMEETQQKIEGKINELYFSSEYNSRLIYAIGLQNYQWGPSELFSPSNPLFHFASNSQDPSYQVPGHSLLRLNYTPNDNWSLIFLYEFAPNEEKSFIYKSQFVPKGLFKAEYRLPSPTDYIGLTLGNEQMHDPFIGQYANFTMEDDFSIYFDLKQTQISKRYYPHVDYGQAPRMNLYDFHDSIYLLSLIGFRIEGDYLDFRWEEISNELGFSQSDFDKISLSFLSGDEQAKENMNAFLYNGRELVSKHYTYLSLRSKNLNAWLDSSFSLRGLYSHRDESSLATFQWDGSIGNRVTFFMNTQANFGKPGTEMNFLSKNRTSAGIKVIW